MPSNKNASNAESTILLAQRQKPLSEQNIGPMKVDPDIRVYMHNLLSKCHERFEDAKGSQEVKELAKRVRSTPKSQLVSSPWACTKDMPPERDTSATKSESNKDTTVGTRKDIATFRHYRSKLTDIWTAAYNNELDEVSLYLECGGDANTTNSQVRRVCVTMCAHLVKITCPIYLRSFTCAGNHCFVFDSLATVKQRCITQL